MNALHITFLTLENNSAEIFPPLALLNDQRYIILHVNNVRFPTTTSMTDINWFFTENQDSLIICIFCTIQHLLTSPQTMIPISDTELEQHVNGKNFNQVVITR